MSEAPKEKAGSEVVDELEALGRQMAAAVKALWDSEDSRKLRQEIGTGFVQVGRQVDEAIKTAQESEAAKEFREQVKETVDKARQADVAGKVEQGLVTALHELNLQLSKLVSSLESSGTAKEGPPAGAGPEAQSEAPTSSDSEK